MNERAHLRDIERRLRHDAPDLARTLDEFDRRDPVPRVIALSLAGVAAVLLSGWAVTAGEELLAGAGLVLASTPVAWLVGAARRIDDRRSP